MHVLTCPRPVTSAPRPRRLIAEAALPVDVRGHAEVARMAFDVPGLVKMPQSEFERRFDELPLDWPLVLACESDSRSLKATYFLVYQGFANAANMGADLAKWARKGFPVTGSATPAAMASAAAGPCSGSTAAASGCCDSTAAASASGACCEPAVANSGCGQA
jgi:rhodanese-related sulfurtransferase